MDYFECRRLEVEGLHVIDAPRLLLLSHTNVSDPPDMWEDHFFNILQANLATYAEPAGFRQLLAFWNITSLPFNATLSVDEAVGEEQGIAHLEVELATGSIEVSASFVTRVDDYAPTWSVERNLFNTDPLNWVSSRILFEVPTQMVAGTMRQTGQTPFSDAPLSSIGVIPARTGYRGGLDLVMEWKGTGNSL